MTMDAIYKERGSDWSHQEFWCGDRYFLGKTQQHDARRIRC